MHQHETGIAYRGMPFIQDTRVIKMKHTLLPSSRLTWMHVCYIGKYTYTAVLKHTIRGEQEDSQEHTKLYWIQDVPTVCVGVQLM